jgi:hypothetical protein
MDREQARQSDKSRLTADSIQTQSEKAASLISVRTKGFPMKISFALVTTATLLLFQVPAVAGTIYPSLPCRVYVDTDYIQTAEQCGTVSRFHPRRLFLQEARRPSYYYCPWY